MKAPVTALTASTTIVSTAMATTATTAMATTTMVSTKAPTTRLRAGARFFASLVSVLILSLPTHAKFEMTKPVGERHKVSKVTIAEIETLDSQLQALAMTVQANETSCHLDPKAVDQALVKKRALLDEKVADFVAPRIHAQGAISIADSTWPRDCETDCHCAVYKLILEVAGPDRLSDHDRKIYRDLTALAMNQPRRERLACATSELNRACSRILK